MPFYVWIPLHCCLYSSYSLVFFSLVVGFLLLRPRRWINKLSLNSVLCPVRAYTHALLTLGSTTCVPAFVFRDSSGNVLSLTKDVFIETFRSVVSRFAGGDISNFTGHSFRRGGASWAFQAGVPGELIQVCGDWASDAYKRYLEFSMDDKLNLAAQFVRHLSQT